MTSPMSRRLVVFAGLLAAPVSTALTQQKIPTPKVADKRLSILRKFFGDRDCPLRGSAADFIEAADRNHLDWRLLPSISMVESSGGKDYRNNNVLGWASCKQRFPSVAAGIHSVAHRLSHSKLYRRKNVDRILTTYNPQPQYRRKVKMMMRTIALAEIPPSTAIN